MSVLVSIFDLLIMEFVYGTGPMKIFKYFHSLSIALTQLSDLFGLLFQKRSTFLHLSIEISNGSIHYEVYSKPGNAYAYLPHGSFHVRISFQAWIKALLTTALTHSSDYKRWSDRCELLLSKLTRLQCNVSFNRIRQNFLG